MLASGGLLLLITQPLQWYSLYNYGTHMFNTHIINIFLHLTHIGPKKPNSILLGTIDSAISPQLGLYTKDQVRALRPLKHLAPLNLIYNLKQWVGKTTTISLNLAVYFYKNKNIFWQKRVDLSFHWVLARNPGTKL